jgi:hypothetical protein
MLGKHGCWLCLQSGDASTSGSELTLADLEDLGVIGSGSSGVAKKVRNKHTSGLLVLKVIQFDVSSDVIRKQASNATAGQHKHPAPGAGMARAAAWQAYFVACPSFLLAGDNRAAYLVWSQPSQHSSLPPSLL